MVLYLGICGSLNEVGTKYPFLGVAVIDLVVIVAVIMLASFGLRGEEKPNEDQIENSSDDTSV